MKKFLLATVGLVALGMAAPASAADLADAFTPVPDFTPFHVRNVVTQVFDPATVRQARGGTPSPRMDDPKHIPGLPRAGNPPR